MAGSPKRSWVNTGDATADREVLVSWENVDTFVEELLRLETSAFPAPYPGKPYLMVDSVEAESLVEDMMIPGTSPPQYTHGALVKIKYKIYTAFNLRTSIGADFITYPSSGLEWVDGGVSLGDDVQAGVRSVNKEHTLSWKRVSRPPWNDIIFSLGKVNAGLFLGASPECLLFNGVDATRTVTVMGTSIWDLEYKFSEKNNGDADDPKGWNHFLRPSVTPVEFQRVQLRGGGGNIYRLVNFNDLKEYGVPTIDLDPLADFEPEHPEI